MASAQELVSVATAARELGLTPRSLRSAIERGRIAAVRLDGRTNLVPRSEIERYRRQTLGRPGRRKKDLTEPAE